MTTQPRPSTLDDYRARILRVLVHIQQNLDGELDLDSLAALSHFSPFHFHRVFSGMVGEGVKEHVRRLRLERAAHQLKHSDDQVIRIALRAGYDTHESFTRAFAAMFDTPPSEFRKAHRAVAYPAVPSGVHYAPGAEPAEFSLAAPRSPAMQVNVEKLPGKRVAFVRHTGPYDQVGQAWARLFAWAGPRGILGPKMEYFGLCHDDPDVTPPDRLRYDACLVVGSGVSGAADIGVQDIPAGEFATAVHSGPYSSLGTTYSALCGQWLPTSGRALGAPPSVEFYLNDPRSTPPAELQTKVCVRLA